MFQTKKIKFMFPLWVILSLIGCPDPEGPTSAKDAAPADTTCMIDEECFNGQHCEDGICVADNHETNTNDAGITTVSSDLINIQFTAPTDRSTAYRWDTITITGAVTTTDGNTEGLTVSLASSLDGPLDVTFDATTGTVNGSISLSEGNHLLKLLVERGEESDVDGVNMTICDYEMNEDFTDAPDPTNWRIFGDAMHVSEGYIEMTNNQQNKYGKIYNIAQRVNPGALETSFKVYTGPNDANGADGFTMTIVDAPSFTELEKILNCSGGMGNAFSINMAGCTMTAEELAIINTFTIEFDTFPNGWLCGHGQNAPTDPTCEDHVSINLNGSGMPYFWLPAGWGDYEPCTGPANNECRAALECIDGMCEPTLPWFDREFLGYGPPSEDAPRFWAAMDNIEDSQWHDVEVSLQDGSARVTFDGEEIINAQVPAFVFKGGYLGFTGGSGAATNYHRFDDLKVEGTCTYNGP